MSTPLSAPSRFVHRLLRARDWQDCPEFAQLCEWWRGPAHAESGMRNAASAETIPPSALPAPHSTGVCALVGIGGASSSSTASSRCNTRPPRPTPGELKDQGVAALLKGLAAASHGLCVVTTRYSLPDLKAFWQTTAPEVKLLRLSRDAGVHLLKTLGVTGTAQEFERLVEDVKGHALTVTSMGTQLAYNSSSSNTASCSDFLGLHVRQANVRCSDASSDARVADWDRLNYSLPAL